MAVKKKAKPRKVTVRVPQLSTVRRPAADLDVANLRLQGGRLSAKLTQAITGGSLEQPMDGASTLTVTVTDWSRGLLRSQLLTGRVTMSFDAISYTLVKISESTDWQLTLTFEETAVNWLRQYSKPRKANRANTTRAQFVRSMVQEVREVRIPFQCPEINARQPIAKASSS